MSYLLSFIRNFFLILKITTIFQWLINDEYAPCWSIDRFSFYFLRINGTRKGNKCGCGILHFVIRETVSLSSLKCDWPEMITVSIIESDRALDSWYISVNSMKRRTSSHIRLRYHSVAVEAIMLLKLECSSMLQFQVYTRLCKLLFTGFNIIFAILPLLPFPQNFSGQLLTELLFD